MSYPNDPRAVGRRIRLVRLTLGFTKAEAAAAARVSQRSYERWEAGGGARTWPLLRFCEKYNVSLDWLIAGDGKFLRRHLTTQTGGKVAILPVKEKLDPAPRSASAGA